MTSIAPGSAGELFKSKNGIDIAHVAYKGSQPALTDVVAGRVDSMFDAIVSAFPFVKDGKLRALAIDASQRSPMLPDVPTMKELGFAGYDVIPWFGIVAPAGTPKPAIEKLNAEFVKALRHPDIAHRLNELGTTVVANSPKEFSAWIASDTERLGKVVKQSGAKLD